MFAGDVSFTVSVKQQNLDLIKVIALEVSTPTHAKYGQHLKQAEIDALTEPKVADTEAVKAWLSTFKSARFTKVGTHLIEVECPVAVAEDMLSTTFHRIENAQHQQVVNRASTEYTIPAHVAGSIEAIFSVHGLPLPPKTVLLSSSGPGEPYKVTPAVIESQYSVSGVKVIAAVPWQGPQLFRVGSHISRFMR